MYTHNITICVGRQYPLFVTVRKFLLLPQDGEKPMPRDPRDREDAVQGGGAPKPVKRASSALLKATPP